MLKKHKMIWPNSAGKTMLINEIRDAIGHSILHNTRDKDVLRVVLAEAQTISMRNKSKISDEMVEKIIRQIISSNLETINAARNPKYGVEASSSFAIAKLMGENAILNKYLPVLLTQEEIKNKLQELIGVLVAAKSDGLATGIAMKFLAENSLKVSGHDVVAIIKEVRKVNLL